jgi:hypothetical protein
MAIRRFSTSSLTTGSKSSKFWDQETLPGAFESIAVATVTSADATITFSNIPQNYTHLQLRTYSQSSTGAPARIRFNSDSGSNYALHVIQGNSASVGTGGVTAQSGIDCIISTISSVTNTFAASIVDILDYTNTSKNKTIKSQAGYETNSNGTVYLYSGLWLNTAAISTITLTDSSGGNFTTYSQFALYGIRGA